MLLSSSSEILDLYSEDKYLCLSCNKAFENSFSYEEHSKRKHYECKTCGTFITLRPNFKKHKQMHRKETVHTCKICSKSFNKRYKLNDHHKRYHTVNIAKQCEKCTKIVINLKSHMQLHNSKKLHQCTLCDHSYSQLNGLRKHMIVHSRINTCIECGKSFSDSSSLNIHIERHRSKRVLKCFQCEKIFRSLVRYSYHIIKHDKPTAYVCNLCDRAFSRIGLKYHMMAHRGEKPHICKDCKKSFRKLVGLKNHMHKTNHMQEPQNECVIIHKNSLHKTEVGDVDLEEGELGADLEEGEI